MCDNSVTEIVTQVGSESCYHRFQYAHHEHIPGKTLISMRCGNCNHRKLVVLPSLEGVSIDRMRKLIGPD